MANRKRSREPNDIDGDVEGESASSSLRQSLNPKRSRIALAQERGGSVVSDDDDVVSNSDTSDGRHHDNAAAVEQFTENDIENVELDEIQMTQMVAHEKQQNKGNIAAESGIIQEVFCRNFMCHSKLRMTLGPNINFIIGHNGSGKSAVLTALTMCLGGKATATNRGASLKSLIKEGQDNASLAVKIKNQGESAYKPELYGRSITVERHFTRAGTSGFKLKSAEDRIISTKKGDLDDILDYFAFQLDNPINVLTQDMARRFLSNSTAADKYKFFIRGTQLEMLDADYGMLENSLDSIEAKLRSRKDDIEFLQKKLDEAERRKRRLEHSASIREKVTQLSNMHAWAQVEEQERILDERADAVHKAEQRVEEVTGAAEGVSGEYEGYNQTFQAAENLLKEHRESLEPIEHNRGLEKAKFDAGTDQLKNRLAEERELKDSMRVQSAKIKELEGHIRTETELLAGADGNDHMARLEELENRKQTAEDTTREQMDHGKGYFELVKNQEKAEEEHRNAQGPRGQCKHAVQQAETNLNKARSDQPRHWNAFPRNMQQLVKAIENEPGWRSKPVGPMGMHIKLLKPEWSSLIEKTFGGKLDNFVVTCKPDQVKLSALMGRMNCRTSIIIGNPERLDTTGKEPAEGVDTILRCLEIDNDLVRNQVIINQFVDQTALVRDRKQAEEFMFEGDRKPHNVKTTICMHDVVRGDGHRLEFTGSGERKHSHVTGYEGQSRMKSTKEDQIRIEQEKVTHARRDQEDAENAFRAASTALNKANQELVRFKRRQDQLKTEKQQADDAVEELQNEIDSLRPQDGKLQALERALEDKKAEKESAAASYQDMTIEKDKISESQNEIKDTLDALSREVDVWRKRITKTEKRLDQARQSREDALRRKNEAMAAIDAAKTYKAQLEEERAEQQDKITEFTGMAQRVCARVPVEEGLTPDVIDQRLARFEQDALRAEREAGGSREKLMTAWQKARQDHAEAIAQLQSIDDTANLLKQSLNNRQGRWKIFRSLISGRARINFIYLLSERSFRGNVSFDHAGKELDISVEPDVTRASDAGRATRTLSGGEKSFSTICLLLSIWEAMGSPIRCLDEFDVFMDSVNRATSMKMMVEAARRAVGRQFILITPQSMNNVNWGNDVHVNKMSDPERGQTTLPYGGG